MGNLSDKGTIKGSPELALVGFAFLPVIVAFTWGTAWYLMAANGPGSVASCGRSVTDMNRTAPARPDRLALLLARLGSLVAAVFVEGSRLRKPRARLYADG